MGWTEQHRRNARRVGLRYPSDLTDAEWALIEPLIPPGRRGGRPRKVDMREVMNAIFYILGTGCQWAALPKDLPPRSTVFHHFALLRTGQTLWRIHDALFAAERKRHHRNPEPTLAVKVAAGELAAVVPVKDVGADRARHDRFPNLTRQGAGLAGAEKSKRQPNWTLMRS